MEKKYKKILLLTVSMVLVAVIIAGIVSAIIWGPMLYINPAETGKVSDVYIIRNAKNNMFLIKSDDGHIAIDAGHDKDKIQEELNRFEIDILEIKYVLITHSHGDHVAALSLFKNAQIYINEDELQMMDGSKGNNSLPEGVKLESINWLRNEELMLGGHKIKCIKTPGHTLGSMIYLVDDKYLFTGDAVEIDKNFLKVHISTMDNKKAEESIEIIIKSLIKNCEYVFTSHYRYFKAEDLNLQIPAGLPKFNHLNFLYQAANY